MRGKTIYLEQDETRLIRTSWEAECEKADTEIESSAWTTTAGTLSDASSDTTTAQVLLTEGGSGTLKNTVTLSNGETLVRVFDIDAP